MSNRIVNFLKAWFGDFSKEELKKFLKLGVIFAVIIGVYWSMRILKDSLFQELVGQDYQPYAKILSLIVLAPIVILYSQLTARLPRKKLLYVISGTYAVLNIVFAVLMSLPSIGLANATPTPYNILGWAWYVFVESFGSLMVVLFWSFTTDITTADSGKRGFSLIVMIGQLGGIFLPAFLTSLPKRTNELISHSAVIAIFAVLIFLIIPMISYFLSSTPSSEMKGFGEKKPEPKDVPADNKRSKKVKPGFLEGLRLLFSQPYLLGIFALISFFEIIVTVFDYHFKTLARSELGNKTDVSQFLGQYASYTNLVTFLCLLFGISNITRRLGVKFSLSMMPIIVAGGIAIIYTSLGSAPISLLNTFFWIMVGAKGLNYALNSPAMKQLYIPLSDDARYQSQAWIETFGSRGSKGAGSVIDTFHKRFLVNFNGAKWGNFENVKGLMYTAKDLGSYWHIALSSFFFFGVCGIWFIIAVYLSNKYKKAVDNDQVIA